MTFKIKHKRGTASSITTANPTLAAGELAFETDTRRFKVGDGTTAWSSLSYVTPYVTATDRILGRSSAGAGAAEEISCTSFGRSLIGSADAAAARTTLSVQPTASPAFTGAATFDNTGNVVPLTVTNAGTANSFVVNDASGDTTPFVITSAGDVTIGTGRTVTGGSGGAFLASNGLNNDLVTTGRAAAITGTWGTLRVHQVKDYAGLRIIGDTSQTASYMDVENSSGTTLVSINSSGQLLVTAGSASACGVAFSGDPDTGIAQLSAAGANTLSICTNSAERVRVDASGNVGIGASSPSSLTPRLHISSAYSAATASTPYNGVFIASSDAQAANTGGVLSLGGLYDASSGPTRFAAIAGLKENGTSGEFGGYLAFYTRANGSTPAERMRIDASGNVGIGATPAALLDLGSASGVKLFTYKSGGANAGVGTDLSGNAFEMSLFAGGTADTHGRISFGRRRVDTGTYTERMAIDASGTITAAQVYSDTVGATNRDLFVDNTGKFGYVSSIRASKTNITAIDDVSWLRDLTPVSFHYRRRNEDGTYSDEPDGTLDYGLIAEEVEPVAPELCFYDVVDGEPQLRGVHYSKLITPMLRYIQQLEARIAALEERNHA